MIYSANARRRVFSVILASHAAAKNPDRFPAAPGSAGCQATKARFNRDSPDDSQTNAKYSRFSGLAASLTRGVDGYRRLGQPERWSRSDQAISPAFWTHSFCQLLLMISFSFKLVSDQSLIGSGVGRSRKPTNARLRRLRAHRRFIGRNRPHGSNMIPRDAGKIRASPFSTRSDDRRSRSQKRSPRRPKRSRNSAPMAGLATTFGPVFIQDRSASGKRDSSAQRQTAQNRLQARNGLRGDRNAAATARQWRAPWPSRGKLAGSKDCVVDLRGLELRARHAVISNRSLRHRKLLGS